MPQVPYEPFATAQPTTEGEPTFRVNAPPEAFGAGVARALQGIGAEIGQASDKFTQTAMQFRQDEMENNVNQAVTQDLLSSGKLNENFRQMAGRDPKDNIRQHVQALQDSRESIRAGLGTDIERKMFDRETMRRFGYDVVNSSNYAATEFKKYTSEARKTTGLTIAGNLVQDPNNDEAIDRGIKSIANLDIKNAVADGSEPQTTLDENGNVKAGMKIEDLSPAAQLQVRASVAKAIGSIAKERANRDPDSAKALVERYKDWLGPNYLAVRDAVNERGMKTSATLESARIVGPDPSLLDIRKAGRNVRTEQLSPEMRDRATDAIAAAEAATGEKASIESAKRTTAEQAVLRQRYLSGQGGLAAPPGTSLHETGDALDLKDGAVLNKLREWYKSGELTSKYGLTMLPDASNDPGHLQLAVGTGYQRPARSPTALADMRGAADDSADALAKKNNWSPIERQTYLDDLNRNITNRVNVQQRDLNIKSKALQDNITNTLNQKLPSGQKPISDDEAAQLNPDFKDQLEQAVHINPGFQETVERHYKINGKGEGHETDARTSARTTAQINRMMRDPDFNPEAVQNAILEARARDPGQPGSLNRADYNDLTKTLADVKTPQGMERKSERDEFVKRYTPTIDPSIGSYPYHHSALGLQKLYEMENVLKSEEKRLGPDWRQLYDPGSKNFFGRPENLMKYHASMQDAAAYQTRIEQAAPAAPPATVPARNQAQAAEARTNVVDVPAEMSPAEALAKFGPGPVRLPNGRVKDLR